MARFVDWWDENWCPAQLHHQMGYWKATADYELQMIREQELWEDLYVKGFSDAQCDHHPRSHDGNLVSYAGHAGTSLPMDWESKLQGSTGMNSGDIESIQWGRCARAMVKLGAMMERTRSTKVQMVGKVDNDALRLAVERGSSSRLGILSRQGT